MMSINGVIGTWAGPCEPGTAYVMLHHSIGDVGDGAMDGSMGSWGYPIGGMGAVSAAIASSAPVVRGEIRTDAPVERILVRDGRAVGVALEDGTEYRVRPGRRGHPPPDHLPPPARPPRPARRLRRATSSAGAARSGTVKINLAIERSADVRRRPGPAAGRTSPESLELCALAGVRRAGVPGRPRPGRGCRAPFSDAVIPSTVDRTLAPEGTHIVSMFTPVGAAHLGRRARTRRSSRRTPTGSSTRYDQLRPGLQEADPPPAGDRPARDGARVRPRSAATSSTASCRPTSCSTCGRRPATATSRRRSAGLYQCSSATHGGGGVTGIAGFLCSPRMLRDRKRRRVPPVAPERQSS